MVKVLLAPDVTRTLLDGEIDPLVPADAVIVYDMELEVVAVNVAEIPWFAVTLLKVYEVTAPTDAPSTRTFDTR
jgi:hypothetical protein